MPHPRRRTFSGARCLVTGASSGLGRALAEHLVRAGARVLLTGRSPDRLEAVAAGLADEGHPRDAAPIEPADLTVEADRARLIARASGLFGGALDLAINSAGVGATGHFDTHGPEILRRVFEINVFALAEVTRAVGPLLARGESPSLVNLGSVVARRALPGRAEYCSSKFAVAGFTESIRAEWAKHGIHVLLLNPGFTATRFEANLLIDTARYKVTRHRTASADAVARAGLRAVLARRNEVTLTPTGKLTVLANRFFPRLVDRGLDRWTRRLFADVAGLPPDPRPDAAPAGIADRAGAP